MKDTFLKKFSCALKIHKNACSP